MGTLHIDERSLEAIRALCRDLRVSSLCAFGSVTRSDYQAASDIDLVVDFEERDPFTYADLYFKLKFALEAILHRPIDLIEARAIRNKYFKAELESTKVQIYGP